MAPSLSEKADWRDMALGGFLQCAEAFTLGMPFEVWKTQQISHMVKTGDYESAWASFRTLWSEGLGKFYHGTNAKMVESASKGAILLYASNATLDVLPSIGLDRKSAVGGMIAGFCGGVAQTCVMSPMTFVITYKNRNKEYAKDNFVAILRRTGLRASYGSAPAMAGRQGTNWALRWFFAQLVTNKYRAAKGSKLNRAEEILCGLVGGACGCVNQPFEVLRVAQQARAATGDPANTRQCAADVYKKFGVKGFYCGLIPRMGLSAWQTLFMVTFAGMIKETLAKRK
jgi:hypothetical protein